MWSMEENGKRLSSFYEKILWISSRRNSCINRIRDGRIKEMKEDESRTFSCSCMCIT